jgi:hypothetical protein
MHRLTLLLLPLLTGCHDWNATRRFWRRVYEFGQLFAIGMCIAVTVMGAFAFRRALRRMRAGGHAVIDSVLSIGLIGVPCWVVVRFDGQDSMVANGMIIFMTLYTLLLLVLFILSVVRWIAARSR